MNQIWTPLSIAVAYFGSQQGILNIDRNLKNFILCFLAMIFGVRLLVYITIKASQSRCVKWVRAWIVGSQLVRVLLLGDRERNRAQRAGDSTESIREGDYP